MFIRFVVKREYLDDTTFTEFDCQTRDMAVKYARAVRDLVELGVSEPIGDVEKGSPKRLIVMRRTSNGGSWVSDQFLSAYKVRY